MCVVTLEEIIEQCGTNTAGNKMLYLANMDDLLTVPAPDADTRTISTDIVMDTGDQFFAFGFTEDTCQHTENINDNDSAIGAITAFFGKDEDKKRHRFTTMIGGKFAVIITDENNVTKYIPNVRFRWDFDSGTDSENDRNGYTVRMSYKGEPAYIYEGTIPLTPGA